MERKLFLQKILVLGTYLAMIVVNMLANILPINQTTGEVSQKYNNLFVPAGYTFMIWGVIYILLAIYILYLFGVFKKVSVPLEKLVGINNLFIFTNLLNALWIFAWHYELIPFSVVVMLGLLVCLILINLQIKKLDLSCAQKWFIAVPFAVYLAWVCVAAVANISAMLVYFNFGGLGLSASAWTVAVLIILTVIATLTTLRLESFAYAITIIWALVGLLVQQIVVYDSQYVVVIVTIIGAIIVMCLTMLYLLKTQHQTKKLF